MVRRLMQPRVQSQGQWALSGTVWWEEGRRTLGGQHSTGMFWRQWEQIPGPAKPPNNNSSHSFRSIWIVLFKISKPCDIYYFIWAFARQEYWSELSCSPPGDLPDPGSEPASIASPALAGTTWEAWCRRESESVSCLVVSDSLWPHGL